MTIKGRKFERKSENLPLHGHFGLFSHRADERKREADLCLSGAVLNAVTTRVPSALRGPGEVNG